MKKSAPFLLGISLVGTIFFTGCTPNNISHTDFSNPTSETNQESGGLFESRKIKFSYRKEMKKPDFETMINKKEVQQAETPVHWSREYEITQDDIDDLKGDIDDTYQCQEIEIIPLGGEKGTSIAQKDFLAGRKIPVQGDYTLHNPIPLTASLIAQIKKHGFGIIDFPEKFSSPEYNTNYNGSFGEEERVRKIRTIGGEHEEYLRSPFNTLLVTNDLLLHTFHKIFSNELQYFEESQARPILAKLSETMFNQFVSKKAGKDQEKNAFLSAYWTIPHALLPSNEELIHLFQKRESTMRDNYDYRSGQDPSAEFSDEELKDYLTKRFEKLLPKVATRYQQPLKDAWNAIWKAEETKTPDYLFTQYSPDFFKATQIEQDYTQFRPRSHYTNSSFLKSYFMAMKWMMREKFYFGDQKLAETALYLANNIPEPELSNISFLQDAILVLIGGDDDATIQDLRFFIGDNQLDGKNLKLTETQLEKLAQLGNQKIISTSYTTPDIGSIDEESAKDITRGFVFFGEKFTLDSYIFDLMTAGSAEKEMLTKPAIQTALMIPDILENYAPANKLVHLWLEEKTKKEDVLENVNCKIGTCKQVSSYPQEKAKAQEKIKSEISDDSLLKTVYHTRLKTLGQLFVEVENAPYFKKSPLYTLKNLVSYMGSYTELKHDTLLYVKQAYAELGAGGPASCTIYVTPPALPVPKGYIEADVNFIDELITLNTTTQQRFKDADNFAGFGNYLQKIRNISLQQMQDQVINDSEFERLRLSYDELANLTYPRKLFGEPSSKLERSAIIADIFTAMGGNPLYEAIGRPMLMALMVKDVNGARIVMGPVFAHYEFYKSDEVLEADQRYSDEDRQSKYDSFSDEERMNTYGIENKELLKNLNE